MGLVSSLTYFVLAGLAEIGGGYLVWLWLRDGRSVLFGIAGFVVLAAYGVIPTLQPAGFGRVYAAYGGIFVMLAALWGWGIDGVQPDRWDIIGSAVSVFGALLIMFGPRS